MEKMKFVAEFSFFINSYTTPLKRLRAGPLLKKITTEMELISKNITSKKMFLYSAHDSTIATTLNTMGIEVVLPPLASSGLV